MNNKTIIGVMGSYSSTEEETVRARELGVLIAQNDWVTMTGGCNVGVMDAALEGAKSEGGTTMAILSGGRDTQDSYSEHIDIPVYTKMNSGRNYTNVLTADVLVVSTALSAGTFSEAALALVEKTPLILLGGSAEEKQLLKNKGGDTVYTAENIKEVVMHIKNIIG